MLPWTRRHDSLVRCLLEEKVTIQTTRNTNLPPGLDVVTRVHSNREGLWVADNELVLMDLSFERLEHWCAHRRGQPLTPSMTDT